MTRIEAQLSRLQNTEDLSYTDRPANELSEPSTDNTDGKQLIDQITLARLIDECREEQEQHAILPPDSDPDGRSNYSLVSMVNSQSELSMMQIARVDRQLETLAEA